MIGCLCIHGFTGAPYEVEPLVEYLKERTNWVFYVPTLPGHGESSYLNGIQYNQWITCAEKELKALFEKCEKVYVIGFSMGGMIASYLATMYPVNKLILLSAAAYYVNPKQLGIDIRNMVKDSLRGNLRKNELFRRYQRKIKETPFTATIQFRKLVSFIRPILTQVKVPTLIAQGECDGIVPPSSAEYLYRTISTEQKKLIYMKNSKHHICYCEEREALFSQVFDFLTDRNI
ncbi:MAG: alpha/beta fold hydrolase [Bacillota bacterium]|nr:alpha/beta fold hydrolase [Bacillota bacterium]